MVAFPGRSKCATQEHFWHTGLVYFEFYWLGTLGSHHHFHDSLSELAWWHVHLMVAATPRFTQQASSPMLSKNVVKSKGEKPNLGAPSPLGNWHIESRRHLDRWQTQEAEKSKIWTARKEGHRQEVGVGVQVTKNVVEVLSKGMGSRWTTPSLQEPKNWRSRGPLREGKDRDRIG